MKTVKIQKEPVELYKLLKFEGLAASGGEAKFLISEGNILVNGQIETRKRRKIFSGNIIEFNEHKIQVKLV